MSDDDGGRVERGDSAEQALRGALSAPDEAMKAMARAAVAEQAHTYEELREQFRRHSRRRQQDFHEPFSVSPKDVLGLDRTVQEAISRVGPAVPRTLEASLTLRDRAEIIFSGATELAEWDEPERSYPVGLKMKWTYTYSPPELPIATPLSYDVIVEYSTEPDVMDKMVMDIEEQVELYVDGPTADWVRSTSVQVEALLASTWMPAWWRYVRIWSTRLKPFVGMLLYIIPFGVALAITAPLLVNPQRQDSLSQIQGTSDVGQKINLLAKALESNSDWSGWIWQFVAAVVAGVGGYLVLSWAYRHAAPPSLIGLGRSGARRASLLSRGYATAWVLVIGTILAAIASRLI